MCEYCGCQQIPSVPALAGSAGATRSHAHSQPAATPTPAPAPMTPNHQEDNA
jgi:hypothetical protein